MAYINPRNDHNGGLKAFFGQVSRMRRHPQSTKPLVEAVTYLLHLRPELCYPLKTRQKNGCSGSSNPSRRMHYSLLYILTSDSKPSLSSTVDTIVSTESEILKNSLKYWMIRTSFGGQFVYTTYLCFIGLVYK